MVQFVTPAVSRGEAQSYKKSRGYVMGVEGAGYAIDQQVAICHFSNIAVGWWSDLQHFIDTGEHKPAERNTGELMMLIVTELAEAFEGERTNQMSDKIPEFTAMEEEFADVLIRIFDTAGAKRMRLGDAYKAKFAYNQSRKDHELEERGKKHGKKY
jgi:NTP pyrophosphatase (non-canonical NTP hydrolase)